MASLQSCPERKLGSLPLGVALCCYLPFCVSPQGMVEKWLQQVEQMMVASMQEVIRLGIEAYVQVSENWGTCATVLVQQQDL